MITIEKAIENLEKEEEDTCMCSEEEWKATIKLSYEGLKRLQQLRTSRITWFRGLLPGETKE